MRGAFVLVNVRKCLPDKARHGHHARMFPLENLAVFTLVWFKVDVQPPLQQFECQAFSTYCSLKTHAHQHGSPEQEARSSVVNVMQGVTQQLEQTEQSEEEECQVFKCALCTD